MDRQPASRKYAAADVGRCEDRRMTARKPVTDRQRETRTYDDVTRANALAVLAACNGNIALASRETGIPARTLASWREKPMSGSLRTAVAVREQLLGQSLERLLWRLLRSAKGKIKDAKLPAVLNGIGVLFDRWRLIRTQPTSDTGDVSGGLDLSRLSSDQLRQLMELVELAGGDRAALGLDSPIVVGHIANGPNDLDASATESVNSGSRGHVGQSQEAKTIFQGDSEGRAVST